MIKNYINVRKSNIKSSNHNKINNKHNSKVNRDIIEINGMKINSNLIKELREATTTCEICRLYWQNRRAIFKFLSVCSDLIKNKSTPDAVIYDIYARTNGNWCGYEAMKKLQERGFNFKNIKKQVINVGCHKLCKGAHISSKTTDGDNKSAIDNKQRKKILEKMLVDSDGETIIINFPSNL